MLNSYPFCVSAIFLASTRFILQTCASDYFFFTDKDINKVESKIMSFLFSVIKLLLLNVKMMLFLLITHLLSTPLHTRFFYRTIKIVE